MSDIEVITLDRGKKKVSKDRLILRPAAYAIIVNDGQLLLVKMRQNGKYNLPGGGIEVGECIHETLIRETREEAGIEITVDRFAHFEEVFFFFDSSGKAYHGLHFYFRCRPLTLNLKPDDLVEDSSAGKPRWVEIQDLHPQEFQYHVEMILGLVGQNSIKFKASV